MDADVRSDPVNARDYLTKVALSEAGFLFVDRNGTFTFLQSDYNQSIGTGHVNFSDTAGSGVPMIDIDLVYGTEELVNSVDVTWTSGGTVAGTATHTDPVSISRYGILAATYDTLLADGTRADDFAEWRVHKLSEPRQRYDAISVNLDSIGTANQADVLALDLGDVVHITWTPNSIGSAIDQFSVIDHIAHEADPSRHDIHFVLSELEDSMTLNDTDLGTLNFNSLGF